MYKYAYVKGPKHQKFVVDFFLTKTELVWLFGYATKKLETK
jgi:hypothetical protein